MVSSQWQVFVLSSVLVGMLSLGVLNPRPGSAQQSQVEICHLEGNGSYHLITISESNFSSHIAHGDGRVGDPVPGAPGFVFDDTCNLVSIRCPCTFTPEVYVNTVGANPATSCLQESPEVTVLRDGFLTGFAAGDGSCLSATLGDIKEEFVITEEETAQCLQDIATTAQTLGISTPCFAGCPAQP
jgi:hypothetical protein